MNELDLFYDLRTLYEIPQKSREVFSYLNTRISPRKDLNQGKERILLLFPTKQISQREYKKGLGKTNMKRIDNRNLLSIYENRIYSYMDVNEVLNTGLVGYSFNQIRFIEG